MSSNTRPVTLFTGQWADLSIDEMAKLAKEMGYDGLELACWGQQFDVDAALDPVSGEDYCNRVWQTLQNHGISCYALSNHLAGQGVCDSASPRLRSILTPKLWGDGITENIN